MKNSASRHRSVLLLSSLLVLFLLIPAAMEAAAHVCDPRAYGAKADGRTLDTSAIQEAIDACAVKGGGIVRLSGGVFLSAPIHLKSGIDLEIDKGATLLGASNHDLYPRKTVFRNPGLWSLVSATNATNVSITGGGTIDGAGESWWKIARAAHDKGIIGKGVLRPRLVVFDHCRHVRVEGITLQNSPFWQLVPYYSDDVVIRDIRVLSPPDSPNTDAVDPFSSSNVLIQHLYADVGDDNIAIKSGAIGSRDNRPSRNIVIEDCTFLHGHGLAIGSEVAGGAKNIMVANVQFQGTKYGIRIKSGRDRGNYIENLTFHHVTMTNVKNPLIINDYYPHRHPPHKDMPHPVTRLTPHLRNIVIEDLRATGARHAGVIAGLPEAPVRNLILRNVSIDTRDGLEMVNAQVFARGLSIHVKRGKPILRYSNVQIERYP